jgi:ABC-type lipoprotein release transport system permease subunit
MATAAIVLMVAAVVAAILPALRAAAIEPTKVLRGD